MSSLTRRSFLKGSAVAAAGATAASALAACSGSGSQEDAGEKQKILRFGQSNAKQGLDMQKSTNSASSSIADSIVEAPLRWNEDNELVTCLLTEIPSFEDDGVTLHCTLKSGIKCHDGSTLTANDVKYTFERMFTPATGAKSTYMYDKIKGAKEMLAGEATELEGLTVEDDTHFTFVLTDPMVTFVNNLGINYGRHLPQRRL
ncbi:MAG: ABC transporter substrate-binding protein [Atopobiaceae bacterium]